MNYIKHLAEAFKMLDAEDQIKPTHIAVYMALFRHWNRNRFKNPMGVIREDIMEKSKIYSITTYYKTIKDLQELGFLFYKPSYNPFTGTSILMTVFTNNVAENRELIQKQQKKNLSKSKNGDLTKEVYISNNINNKNNNIYIDKIQNEKMISLSKKGQTGRPKFEEPSIQIVKLYFEEVKSTKDEAERFYNYYSSNGWLVGGKARMKNWEAAARNWILNSDKFRPKETSKHLKPDHLHVKTDKNYGEPL